MRYSEENVLVLKVPHLRIYDGESDRLLVRTRADRVEHDVAKIFEGGDVPEPSWFLERWLEAWGCLIVVIVYDDPAGVVKFKERHDELGLGYIWGDDYVAEIKAAEVLHLNEEWDKAHRKTMEATEKVLEANAGAVGQTLIFSADVIPGGSETVQAASERMFCELNAKLQNQLGMTAEDSFKFRYATMLAVEKKRLMMAMCFKTREECHEFMDKISVPAGWELGHANHVIEIAIACGDGEEIVEALKQITAAVAKES